MKNIIEKELDDILLSLITDKATELMVEMKEITPVDTGDLKSDYSINNNDGESVSIINDMHYAHQILVLGRTGPRMGSLQLPDGILPFIKSWGKKNGGKLL